MICPHCGSADTQVMLGDQFKCLTCGKFSDEEATDGEVE